MEPTHLHAGTATVLLEFGESLGLERDALIEAAEFDPSVLDDPEGELPFEVPMRLWDYMIAHRPDEPLGLMLGERLRPEAFGLPGHLMRHSEDVGQMTQRLTRYQGLIDPWLELRTRKDAGWHRIEFHHHPRVEKLAYPLEGMVGAAVHTIRDWLDREVALQVWFRHGPLYDPALYRARLSNEVSFEQPVNAVLLPEKLLAEHLPQADPAVAEFLSRMADERLEQAAGEPLIRRVEHAIERSVDQIDLTQDEVAVAVGVSVRTMQRRLREASLTYTELVQRIRRATAVRLLRETDHPIYQVAEMVGYAEAASFTRAFRQWTGTTPNAFRHRGSG